MKKEHMKVIAARIEELERDIDGTVSPRDVVKAARDPNDPMHAHFTWEDGAAAENWRLHEARILIRAVTKYKHTLTEYQITVPKYVSTVNQRTKERAYAQLDRVKEDTEKARQLFSEELQRAINIVQRALVISEELGLAKEMEQALRTLLEAQEKAA